MTSEHVRKLAKLEALRLEVLQSGAPGAVKADMLKRIEAMNRNIQAERNRETALRYDPTDAIPSRCWGGGLEPMPSAQERERKKDRERRRHKT